MKLWTVEFQVPELINIPAADEVEAIAMAWEEIREIGYIYAGATEQLEEDYIYGCLCESYESCPKCLTKEEKPDILSPDGN